MVHEGYVAHLHVTNKNDKHEIHKIYAKQYRNTMNNYGFPTINLLKSTWFNRLLNNVSRSVETIYLDNEFHALITRTAKNVSYNLLVMVEEPA